MGKRNNSIIITGIVAAFIIGTLTANPVADAASPMVNLLTDLTFGLEAIKNAIDGISTDTGQIIADIAALSIGLSATTETQIDNIEAETNKIQMVKDDVGLIKTETNKIQMVKDDVGLIKTETNKIQMVKDDVGAIKTETDKIQMMKDDVGMIKGNQFVPYRAFTFLPGEICAQSGSVDEDFLLIDAQGSGTFFIIKSVRMFFVGLDAVDIVRTQSLLLSGGGFTYRSVDLSGTQSVGVNIEFLGAPLEFQPTTFPSEIFGFISGSQDVKIKFHCDNSNGGNDITLSQVTVFGWAPPGTTFNLQYQE